MVGRRWSYSCLLITVLASTSSIARIVEVMSYIQKPVHITFDLARNYNTIANIEAAKPGQPAQKAEFTHPTKRNEIRTAIVNSPENPLQIIIPNQGSGAFSRASQLDKIRIKIADINIEVPTDKIPNNRDVKLSIRYKNPNKLDITQENIDVAIAT